MRHRDKLLALTPRCADQMLTPPSAGENPLVAGLVVTQVTGLPGAESFSYNATIAAGGSNSVGFQGTWISSDAAPTALTLNGATCST